MDILITLMFDLAPAVTNPSLTPFFSLEEFTNTSDVPLMVNKSDLYATPTAFPSVPRGAAAIPAIAVPCPQSSLAESFDFHHQLPEYLVLILLTDLDPENH